MAVALWAVPLALLAGCKLDLTGATCNTNENCPVRQYCAVPPGVRQGSCKPGERFMATLSLTVDPPILPAGGSAQGVATLTTDGGPPVPDGGLVTELVEWSVKPGSEGVVSLGDDAGTRALVQAVAPGQATLLGTMVFSDQRLDATTTVVVSNAALLRIVTVADRLQYAPGTPGNATATGFFSDGTHADLTSLVKWSSSDPTVLAVSGAAGSWGRLSALAPGQVSLRATYQNLTGTTSVTVGAAALVALSISPSYPRGLEGSDLQLEATGVFSDGTAQTMTRSVQWSLDDQTLGYFASPGVATLLTRGTTDVRATAGSVQAEAQLEVVPPAPVQLEISPPWPDPLLVDSTLRLSAWTTHQDGTVISASAAWSSSAPALSISGSGDLLAETPGLATVTATTGPLEARATAEATADAGVSWLLWPPEVVVPVGAEGKLALERAHADGTVQDLTTAAGWRQGEGDAGSLDVETGETGGTVRPRQPGSRAAALAILPGKVARAWVRAPAGAPTLELVPAAGAFPVAARMRLAAVGHWPDGTVVDLTAAASWRASPDGIVLAGDGPSAGLVLGADAGVSTLRVRFGGATAQATVVAEPDTGALELWPPGATLAAGTALPLSVTLLARSGESTDVTADAVWTSSNPKVSVVTNAPGQQGQLLGNGPGAAVMTARVDGLQATLPVVVTGARLQSVAPEGPAAAVTWAPVRLRATGVFSDGTTQDLTRWVSWTSSDPDVLRLRGTGRERGAALGVDAGAVVVSARPRGGPRATLPLGVNGTALASLSVATPSGPVALGTRPRVQAVAHGADGTAVDVTELVEWTSSDPSVGTVSSVVRPGWVTTLHTGPTVLGARFGGLGATAPLQVSGDVLTALAVAAPPTLAVGSTSTAIATATLSGGGSQALGEDVVWSSDSPGVVGVSNAPGARGRLLALGSGSATVRARTRSGLPTLQAAAVVMVSPPTLRAPARGGDRAAAPGE